MSCDENDTVHKGPWYWLLAGLSEKGTQRPNVIEPRSHSL